MAYHYINDGHHLYYSYPTIERDQQSPPNITHINYSPPFQAPFPLSTPPAFYAALGLFANLANDPKVFLEKMLKEGDTVIFDNRRLLHARRAFSNVSEETGEVKVNTNRWMKGCYVEEDVMLDKAGVLRKKLEKGEI